MRHCASIGVQRMVLGILLIIWVLMGGVALAEQLNWLDETSLLDEEALSSLQHALKSEPPGHHIQTAEILSEQFPACAEAAPAVPPFPQAASPPLLRSKDTTCVFKIVSCFRI